MKGEGFNKYQIGALIIFLSICGFGMLFGFFLYEITHGKPFQQQPTLDFVCGEYENMTTMKLNFDYVSGSFRTEEDDSLMNDLLKLMTLGLLERRKIISQQRINPELIQFLDDDGNIIINEAFVKRFGEYINESVCTNNLSFAYCKGSPDECNDRYDIPWGFEICIEDRCSPCGGCENCFEQKCVDDCFENYREYGYEGFKWDEEIGMSKLICHASEQECERRYA